jgi:hypothetical protein
MIAIGKQLAVRIADSQEKAGQIARSEVQFC